jgi:hypothetical protein
MVQHTAESGAPEVQEVLRRFVKREQHDVLCGEWILGLSFKLKAFQPHFD